MCLLHSASLRTTLLCHAFRYYGKKLQMALRNFYSVKVMHIHFRMSHFDGHYSKGLRYHVARSDCFSFVCSVISFLCRVFLHRANTEMDRKEGRNLLFNCSLGKNHIYSSNPGWIQQGPKLQWVLT